MFNIQSADEIINQAPVKEWFDYVIPLLPTVIALIAVIIAYNVWKNYDLKKHVLKYQLDEVFKLVNVLQTTAWSLEIKDKGGRNLFTKVLVRKIEYLLEYEKIKDLIKEEAYFSRGTIHNLELFNFINNRFIPNNIADQIAKLRAGTTSYTMPEVLKTLGPHIYISAREIAGEEVLFANHAGVLGKKDKTFHSFKSYFKEVLRLQTLIDEWLDKTQVKDLNTKYRRP